MTQQVMGPGTANAGRQPDPIPGHASPAEGHVVWGERIASEAVTRAVYAARSTAHGDLMTSRFRRTEYRVRTDGPVLLHDSEMPCDWAEELAEPTKVRLFATGETFAEILAPFGSDLSLVVEERELPPDDEDLLVWDHVAEFSLDVPSGVLCFQANLKAPPVIRVIPGTHRVRIYYGNLGLVYREHGLPFGGPLRPRLTPWPRDRTYSVVLKQWAGRIFD